VSFRLTQVVDPPPRSITLSLCESAIMPAVTSGSAGSSRRCEFAGRAPSSERWRVVLRSDAQAVSMMANMRLESVGPHDLLAWFSSRKRRIPMPKSPRAFSKKSIAVDRRLLKELEKYLANTPTEVLGHLAAPAYCCGNGTVGLVKIDKGRRSTRKK